VSRPPADSNVRLLFRSTFLFGLACGISIALTALHLDAHGYTKTNIGSLAVWFASGIVLMSLPAGAFIRKFSAKRTLVACMLSYAVCVTAFPFLPSYASIAFVRFFDGASSVGIWVASETILLSRTRNEDKAHYTSIYAIWLASGYVVGSVVATGIQTILPMSRSFVVSGVLALVAAAVLAALLEPDAPEQGAPAAVTSTDTEAPAAEPPASSGTLLWRIKCSCFATYAYGYFQASVVLFLPLYLIESKGIVRDRTIILPGLFSLGMLLFSNPAGRIGDRTGHLGVMRVLGFIGMLMILGFVFLDSYWLMCAAVFIAGSTLAAMSPVSLALQGVVTEKKNYSRSNAIYNVFYASGMLMGPPISSALFGAYGGKAMLYHLAALYAAFLVFSVVFREDDPAVARERQRRARA
jgi:MFS family permease